MLNDDLLDGLADFHNLCSARSGVGIKPAPLGPIICVVVMSYVGEECIAPPFMKDNPDIASYPR